jgi:hypothetical protein
VETCQVSQPHPENKEEGGACEAVSGLKIMKAGNKKTVAKDVLSEPFPLWLSIFRIFTAYLLTLLLIGGQFLCKIKFILQDFHQTQEPFQCFFQLCHP